MEVLHCSQIEVKVHKAGPGLLQLLVSSCLKTLLSPGSENLHGLRDREMRPGGVFF